MWMSAGSVEFLARVCSSLHGCQSFLEGATALAGPHTVTISLGPRALGVAPRCLITLLGSVPNSHRLFLGVRDP
jgi:hypothetical protein